MYRQQATHLLAVVSLLLLVPGTGAWADPADCRLFGWTDRNEMNPRTAADAIFADWARRDGALILPGDFDGDGRTDLGLVLQAGDWDALPVAYSLVGGLVRSTYRPAGQFARRARTSGVVAVSGDFDGDGRTDIGLVRRIGDWRTLSVAYSQADGSVRWKNRLAPSFARWARASDVRILTGDFDGNGLTDLALVRQGGNWSSLPVAYSQVDDTVRVVNRPAPSFARWARAPGVEVVTGDFDGDGRTDLALVRLGGNWSSLPVAYSEADDTVRVVNRPAADFARWARESGVVVTSGDFDGDERTDLTLVRLGGNWSSLPVAYSEDGDTVRVVNRPAADFAHRARESGVVVARGDFDGDGRTDLGLVRRDEGWSSLPVAYSEDGDTVRVVDRPTVDFDAWATRSGVVVTTGDFDGNGRDDLALVRHDEGWSTLPVALSRGDGTVLELNHRGVPLHCRLDSADVQPASGPPYGNFQIYFTVCDPGDCEDEQITETDAELMAHSLECSWALFYNPEMSSFELAFTELFAVPQWLKVPDGEHHVPVWINKRSGAAGASLKPRLEFPAHGRLADPVTANAIHELGHLLEWSYGGLVAGGPLPFINEGLPTFLALALREVDRRYGRDCTPWKFLDLTDSSLRKQAYCDALPFWLFLAEHTDLGDVWRFYEHGELVPACEEYLGHLPYEVSFGGRMRRIPGRDVVKEVLESLAACFPEARETPTCVYAGGYDAVCSNPWSPSGCLPDADLGDDARGEVLMPKAMMQIDKAFLEFRGAMYPLVGDGIGSVAFRKFLEWNYERDDARPSVLGGGDRHRIKAYGAHYFEVDLSAGPRTLEIEKEGDLPRWAFGVFSKGDRLQAYEGWLDDGTYRPVSGWSDSDSASIVLEAPPGFDSVVVIVTAFGKIYDPTTDASYDASGGHYSVSF